MFSDYSSTAVNIVKNGLRLLSCASAVGFYGRGEVRMAFLEPRQYWRYLLVPLFFCLHLSPSHSLCIPAPPSPYRCLSTCPIGGRRARQLPSFYITAPAVNQAASSQALVHTQWGLNRSTEQSLRSRQAKVHTGTFSLFLAARARRVRGVTENLIYRASPAWLRTETKTARVEAKNNQTITNL